MDGPTVLHVHKVSGVSGSERHLSLLLPGLVAAGWRVRAVLLLAGEGHRAVELLRDRGVEVDTLPAGPDLNPMLVARLTRTVRRARPTLVHTHLIHGDLYGQLAARAGGAVGVSSLHSSHPFYGRNPVRAVARAAGRSARRTIAISDHVRRFALGHRLVPEERLRVVRYGIDADRWAGRPGQREEVRAELGLGVDDVAVGVASRLAPHKGHDVLIDAVARASHELPGLRLLVAGGGPLREELGRRAAASGADVRFLGFLDDVPSFLAACDVAAFPTLPGFGEGFGLAALEAMAAGRPLVASALDSLPEIVDHDATGLLVPPGDGPALAAAVVRLGRDRAERDRMGQAAQQQARRRFSVDAMVAGTLDVYEEARL